MTLAATEAECAANAIAPRVSLADIEQAILLRFDFTADEAAPFAAVIESENSLDVLAAAYANLRVLSICLLVMRNGFMVIGKSAPASPENFDAELGRKLAYEDAVRHLWPLMGFALRDRLMTPVIAVAVG